MGLPQPLISFDVWFFSLSHMEQHQTSLSIVEMATHSTNIEEKNGL